MPWGQCTWYVAVRRPDTYAWASGNAWNWANAATAAGRPTGPDPQVGAVATFQPGIEGAGAAGHVAIVEQVAEDGQHFLVSEMHAPVLGAITQRWAVAGRGVRFVY